MTGIGNFNAPATNLGSLDLASSGYSQSASEHLVQLADTAVLSLAAINETHFQFARNYIGDASQSTLPQVNVTSAFVSGGSGYSAVGYGSAYDLQDQYELQDYTSLSKGAHTMKSGIRLRRRQFSDYSPKNFKGTYTFEGSSSGSLLH